MDSQCKEYLDLIPRSLAGDLGAQDQQRLDLHLAGCCLCRKEQARFENSLEMLQTLSDEPVPRHFFIYPPEHGAGLRHLFRHKGPLWKTALAGAFALLFFLSAAAVSGLRIQSERGTWSVSFGRADAGIDTAALKADILKTVEENSRENARILIQDLRAELSSRTNLGQRQQIELAETLSSLERRLGNRINAAADDVRAGAGKANMDLYQAVSLQREQDLNRVNTRLDRIVDANETRFRQNEEILETLLQIVMNLK